MKCGIGASFLFLSQKKSPVTHLRTLINTNLEKGALGVVASNWPWLFVAVHFVWKMIKGVTFIIDPAKIKWSYVSHSFWLSGKALIRSGIYWPNSSFSIQFHYQKSHFSFILIPIPCKLNRFFNRFKKGWVKPYILHTWVKPLKLEGKL